MIELRGVSLDAGSRTLLHDVSADIAPGEFVAVLGRNGAGKTTLLRAIAGLHAVRHGEIIIGGLESRRLSISERARRIALVTGDDAFFEALLVRDAVSIGRFAYGNWWRWQRGAADDRAIDDALAAVQMETFSRRLFSTLSAGERQRVWIALGLAQETHILLLDEPTSHLDAAVAETILRLLRALSRSGKTVVCALHDVNEAASYADRIAFLTEQSLLKLIPSEELGDGDWLERTYGIAFERRAALLPVRGGGS